LSLVLRAESGRGPCPAWALVPVPGAGDFPADLIEPGPRGCELVSVSDEIHRDRVVDQELSWSAFEGAWRWNPTGNRKRRHDPDTRMSLAT
jgi:hypothetical protein